LDEQIKSKKLCRSGFFCKKDNYAIQSCQKAGHMVAGDVDFCFFALEMRDLNKLTSKLELTGECLILVNISMFSNHCKNLLAEKYLLSF